MDVIYYYYFLIKIKQTHCLLEVQIVSRKEKKERRLRKKREKVKNSLHRQTDLGQLVLRIASE